MKHHFALVGSFKAKLEAAAAAAAAVLPANQLSDVLAGGVAVASTTSKPLTPALSTFVALSTKETVALASMASGGSHDQDSGSIMSHGGRSTAGQRSSAVSKVSGSRHNRRSSTATAMTSSMSRSSALSSAHITLDCLLAASMTEEMKMLVLKV